MSGDATGTGRPRPRRWIWALAAAGAVALGAWLAGLLWFITLLPTAVADTASTTDAIVVLTGGSGRVAQGLELLAQRRAQKLFISGVYRGVDVQALLRTSQQSPAELQCCVALGYEADSTYGNAIETAGWMRANGLRSLRLVTAAYHMPRSLLEFRRAMPEIAIVAHPVYSEHFQPDDWWPWAGTTSLILSEYGKYVVALIYDRTPRQRQ
jgi:uncharacterized SAM-binding protein YcdF (DUF218 family)